MKRVSTSAIIIFLLNIFSFGQGNSQPNIIFILSDDLGYGDLGVLFQNSRTGSKVTTPELDKMAKEGMILNRHYTPAPVCAPSRSSLISGMHQGHANIRNNQFDKEMENNHNFANSLKTSGYYTILIGKYGLQGSGSSPTAWPAYPTKRGFDYFFGYVRHSDGHQHYPGNTWALGNSAAHRATKELYENNNDISSTLDKCYTQDLFTAKAKQLIQDRATNFANIPFFMFLSFDTPHGALQLPTMAYPNGSGINGGLQWLGTSGNMINTASGTIDSYMNPLYAGTTWSNAGKRSATVISRQDQSVGDVLQTLKDLNIDSNTIVIFSSDNGPHNESYISGSSYAPTVFQSYANFEGMKRDVYEGGIRMPTITWGPTNILVDSITDIPSQFHDWMATFLDYAGAEIPARLDGVSIKPTLSGQGTQTEGTVYIEYGTGGSMPNYSDFSNHGGTTRAQAQVVYMDGYKGLRNNVTNNNNNFKIFNTLTDLDEANDLAGTSTLFNTLQQKMKDRVLQIRMPNSSAARPYDNVNVPDVTITSPVNSLIIKTYQGNWDWVPAFENILELGAYSDSTVNLDRLTQNNNAGLLFTGYISIPTAGTWTFFGTSDEGLIFKIHDKLVLDGDFGYNQNEISQAVNLEAGLHPFRLYYRTGTSTPALNLSWSGPSVSKQSIPAANFFIPDSEVPILKREIKNGVGLKYLPSERRTIDGRKQIKMNPKWWQVLLP